MRILTPVDFSDYSKAAVQFAATFAKQAQAELLLIHVLPDLGPTIGRQRTVELMLQMQETAISEFKNLVEILPPEQQNVSTLIIYGSAIYKAITAAIETNRIDIVIMASKGAGGIKRALMGSNAVDVVNHCSIPVIIVPEIREFSRVKSLVYASDFDNLREEIRMLIPLARLLGAEINIINLSPRFYVEYIDTDRLISDIQNDYDFEDIKLTLLEGKSVAQVLEDYVLSSRGELLTMFTHKTSFVDQLFRRSITREIAWHNKIPILVFPNTNAIP